MESDFRFLLNKTNEESVELFNKILLFLKAYAPPKDIYMNTVTFLEIFGKDGFTK